MYIAPVGSRNPYRRANSLAELLSWHDVDFVRCAYVTIIGRAPDADGEAYYTDRIRRGHSPMEVLWQLRRSSEGRKHDSGIKGLDWQLRKAHWRANRWIGWLLAPFLGGEGGSAAWRRTRILSNQLGRLQNSLETFGSGGQFGSGANSTAIDAAALLQEAVGDHVAHPELGTRESRSSAVSGPILLLDADRMLPVEQWPSVSRAMFERHWPNHKARANSAEIDSDQRLWVVISGKVSDAVAAETVRSLRALRDSAPFDVEFASLGPKAPVGGKAFSSLKSLAEAIDDEALVWFVGPRDQMDAHLAEALVLEHAWNRDFLLTDQFYVDDGRVAPLLFHGIDHHHLAHSDYFSSRFFSSAKLLRAAVKSGAKTPLEVARWELNALRERPGKRLHLQYPFLRNGDLTIEAVRQSRREKMQYLAELPEPKPDWDSTVSVIISTKDGGYLLDGLVHQLLAIPRIAEILIVSNNTSGDYTLGLLDRLAKDERCRVFRYDRPFNFSVQCNHAAKEAKGNFLLIMNDDVSLIGSDWLDKLLSITDSEHPRIAGPLLLYPNQSIQQGGMYLGHNGRAGHTFRHQRHPHDAPMFELVAPRLVSCLTGACLLMKRSFFNDLNGFDEHLATGLQDVDLCLRASHAGAELVFDPRAIIFHLESISLIPTLVDESVQRRRDREYARFRERWGAELHSDPWHNRNFYIEDEALRHLRIAD